MHEITSIPITVTFKASILKMYSELTFFTPTEAAQVDLALQASLHLYSSSVFVGLQT